MPEDEEDFVDSREDTYDSTEQWEDLQELRRMRRMGCHIPQQGVHRHNHDITAPYIPGPEEIQQRIRDMDWLRRMGFDERSIASIMQKDTPPIDEVMDAVADLVMSPEWRKRHKFRKVTEAAWRAAAAQVQVDIRPNLARTEYD